ncbi:peptidoglycan-binding protein [Methylobacterium organophilum]|uniref:peptidoglycan-binding protein n=1 Tax=Methylobacterium organophilum TaxID=410 RepID=UPI001F13C633|nr:peptidoglycan-binding protein [Methylobacterium organophilum]UMY16677.1 peptidoglycan-binding protein [Methylobacterium organophilum]
MFSASALLSAILSLLARTFGNVIVGWIDGARAAEAQRELGAAREAASAHQEAERQEAAAERAGDAAADDPDDPRDLRRD